MALFRRDPLKAAEADVTSLSARLDSLRVRMGKAQGVAETAIAEQRRLLVETDGGDAAALRKAGDAARKAQDDVAAYQEAERELVRLVGEAQARTSAERDRIERERLARAIEDKAAALTACVVVEEQAVRVLAEAHQATRLAAYAAITSIGPAIDAESLIGELKAVSLHVAYPVEFSVAPFSRSLAAPCSTLSSAASTYLAQLRAEAEAIRSGTAPLQASGASEAT